MMTHLVTFSKRGSNDTVTVISNQVPELNSRIEVLGEGADFLISGKVVDVCYRFAMDNKISYHHSYSETVVFVTVD